MSVMCVVVGYMLIIDITGIYVCTYVCVVIYYQIFTFNYRQSAAHGNFHFIGPGLVMMCHSMKEKVLALNDDNKEVKSTKAGCNLVYYACTWLHIVDQKHPRKREFIAM